MFIQLVVFFRTLSNIPTDAFLKIYNGQQEEGMLPKSVKKYTRQNFVPSGKFVTKYKYLDNVTQ